MPKNMCRHGAHCCFTMCAANAYIKRTFSDQLQHIAALNHFVIIVSVVQQLCMLFRHCRCVHNQFNICRNCIYIFCIMNINSCFFQLFSKCSLCFIVATYFNSLCMIITGNCTHPNTADANEIQPPRP